MPPDSQRTVVPVPAHVGRFGPLFENYRPPDKSAEVPVFT